MKKEQKINYIKYWLQKFGERDNETFNIEVEVNGVIFHISMQYNFDECGDEILPYDWCRNGFKHLITNSISDRTESELDEIINKLKIKKIFY